MTDTLGADDPQRVSTDISQLNFGKTRLDIEGVGGPVFIEMPERTFMALPDEEKSRIVEEITATIGETPPEQLPPSLDPRLEREQPTTGVLGDIAQPEPTTPMEAVAEIAGNAFDFLTDVDEKTGEIGAATVARSIVKNTAASAQKLANDVAKALSNPLAVVESLGEIGLGGIQKLIPGEQSSEEKFDAVIDFYADRFGGAEELKRTIATDPVGAVLDLTVLLTGGGALGARAPGVLGQASRTAQQVGRTIDPVRVAGRAVRPVVRVSTRAVGELTGILAGTGFRPLREAFAAGRRGGEALRVFRENLRGNMDFEGLVDSARAAVNELRNQRGIRYRSGMVDISRDATVLNMRPIVNTVTNAVNNRQFQGLLRQPRTAPAMRAVIDEVRGHLRRNPAQFHTPEGLDALKQRIGNIRSSIPFENRPARSFVNEVYNSVRDQIVRQAPAYGDIMADYERATRVVNEIESALSLGQRATVDTAMRKLQSVMRDNVTTGFGRRVDLATLLVENGAVNLMEALAGQALSPGTPRGLARLGPGAAVGVGTAVDPAVLGLLPAQSPRLAGETAKLAGQAAGVAERTIPAIAAGAAQVGRQPGFREQVE